MLHPGRVERRAPPAVVVLRELEVDALAVHSYGDATMPSHESSQVCRAEGRSPDVRKRCYSQERGRVTHPSAQRSWYVRLLPPCIPELVACHLPHGDVEHHVGPDEIVW